MRIQVVVMVVMGSWFAVSSARADKPVAPKAGAAMCVFVIGVPKHKDSRAQLTALGARVLARLAR